jgi:hypothetical protein
LQLGLVVGAQAALAVALGFQLLLHVGQPQKPQQAHHHGGDEQVQRIARHSRPLDDGSRRSSPLNCAPARRSSCDTSMFRIEVLAIAATDQEDLARWAAEAACCASLAPLQRTRIVKL